LRGHPTPVRMATAAGNPELRQRLWDVSDALGGLQS
jgi:hypothetical protein